MHSHRKVDVKQNLILATMDKSQSQYNHSGDTAAAAPR